MRGPWLLEASQLLALDEILEQFCSRKVEVPEGVGVLHGFQSTKSLTIFLSKDRQLKSDSFKEAMSHIASQNEVASGFEYRAIVPNMTALVRLLPSKKGEQKKDQEEQFLEIRVDSPSSATSYEIFLELRNWADTVEAPLWRQWFLFEPRPLYRIGLVFPLIILLAMLFNSSPTAPEYKDALKQQARDLLRNGINQQNQTKALELVLALESDYIPPGTNPRRARKPIIECLIAVYCRLLRLIVSGYGRAKDSCAGGTYG